MAYSLKKTISHTSILLGILSFTACSYLPNKASPASNTTDKQALQQSNSYTVHKGDTLYSIARKTKVSVKRLVQLNNLRKPYTIYVGQKLLLKPAANYVPPPTKPAKKRPTPPPKKTPPTYRRPPPPIYQTPSADPQRPTRRVYRAPPTRPKTVYTSKNRKMQCTPPVQWRWPTRGHTKTSISATGNRGVKVYGRFRQAIHASASGKIVYSGKGFNGYTNLIIIQHNDAFLSAYAHNYRRFINEGTYVASGQRIAEMGADHNKKAVLHFEIRCHGKAVDPLMYLPK